jgi:hypothetical protein
MAIPGGGRQGLADRFKVAHYHRPVVVQVGNPIPFHFREIQPPVILNLPWQVKNPPAVSRLDVVWGFFNR